MARTTLIPPPRVRGGRRCNTECRWLPHRLRLLVRLRRIAAAQLTALANCSADPYCRLLPQDGFIRARGWIDGGILGNTSNPASHFNGPYNASRSTTAS